MSRFLLGAVATASILTTVASAQVVVVDEGSFSITVNGERAGREEFRIRSTPGPRGSTIIAQATVSFNDRRRVMPALSVDSLGAPLGYDVEVKNGPDTEEKLNGTISRGRISVRIRNPRGESAKEYVVANGAFILDDDVFHQYYFLARSKRTGSVPVVIPRRNVQVTFRVSSAGSESIQIGSQTLSAEKLVLTEPGGEAREVWVDSAGRVLKVVIPARGLTALRDDPPR